jgi:hypothetical protein
VLDPPQGKYAHRTKDYQDFVTAVNEWRTDKGQTKTASRKGSAAKRAAAAEMGAKAEKQGQLQPPGKSKKARTSTLYDFGFGKDIGQWNRSIARNMARFFLGEAIADKKADSPLWHTLVDNLLMAGKAGCTTPPYALLAQSGAKPDQQTHIVLPTRYDIGGALLDEQYESVAKQVQQRAFGKDGTKQCGFGLTSDGTNRFSRGVMNVALTFKDGGVVFWDLKETSGETKNASWITDFIVDCVLNDDFPLDPKDLVTITMDGACRTAFSAIETAFREHPDLSPVVCLWCSAHTFQLLLKAIADIDGIDTLIQDCRDVITFVRAHDKPTAFLRAKAGKGLVRWVETRFATIFLCMERLREVSRELKLVVASDEWDEYAQTVKDKSTRGKLDVFVDHVLDVRFWNRITKTLELVEPIYAALRRCDSDEPTVGVVYQLFLEVQEHAKEWEETKFDGVKTGASGRAFDPQECTLLSNCNHEDTGRDAGKIWSAVDIVAFRWGKMDGATSTGTVHLAARHCNPAYRNYEHDVGGQAQLVKYLRMFKDNKQWGDQAFSEWQDYQTWARVSPDDDLAGLFYIGPDGSRVEKDTCSASGPAHGLRGADWWIDLPFERQKQWGKIREVAMKLLSQTSSESAAERHFSTIEQIQPKMRASLSVPSVRKRSFVLAEIHSSIDRRASVLLTANDLDEHEAGSRPDSLYSDLSEDCLEADLSEDSLEDPRYCRSPI